MNMLSEPARRCLVPVTDFCEWSGEAGSELEYWFSLGLQLEGEQRWPEEIDDDACAPAQPFPSQWMTTALSGVGS